LTVAVVLLLCALAVELAVARLLPVSWAARVAWVPVGRTRRFRFATPEEALPEEAPAPKRLDASVGLELRVVREHRAWLALPRKHGRTLYRLRARWVGDELVVTLRHWPEHFVALVAVGCAVLALRGAGAAESALAASLFAASLLALRGARGIRDGADALVVELLDAARPWPSAAPLEIDPRGNLVPARKPRVRSDGELDVEGRWGSLVLTLPFGAGACFSGASAMLGPALVDIATRPADAALGVLLFVVFAPLTGLAFSASVGALLQAAQGRTRAFSWRLFGAGLASLAALLALVAGRARGELQKNYELGAVLLGVFGLFLVLEPRVGNRAERSLRRWFRGSGAPDP
jgi:hypothetical protein